MGREQLRVLDLAREGSQEAKGAAALKVIQSVRHHHQPKYGCLTPQTEA